MHRGPEALLPPFPFAAAIDASYSALNSRSFRLFWFDAGPSSSQAIAVVARAVKSSAMQYVFTRNRAKPQRGWILLCQTTDRTHEFLTAQGTRMSLAGLLTVEGTRNYKRQNR
jgi:hypothetical protein